ncbi:MAG: type II toxin-antitoxin system VapC family toxin [Spirochaetaceae bacterium]|nr:type II toxin-antitoxin system VapC family toxin [Spirochaetaceae bacterium]
MEAPDDLEAALEQERFQHLPITVGHALAVAELPAIHGDPFDRIQIAQARVDALTIVTRDATIPRYDMPCLRA